MADETTRLVKWLAGIVGIVLVLTLLASLNLYQHPMPASDCSKPYDYPMCARAVTPQAAAPTSPVILLVNTLIMFFLAVGLVYASYSACVTEQATIVAPMANTSISASSSASASSSGSTNSSNQGTSLGATNVANATIPSSTEKQNEKSKSTKNDKQEPVDKPAAKPTKGLSDAEIAKLKD